MMVFWSDEIEIYGKWWLFLKTFHLWYIVHTRNLILVNNFWWFMLVLGELYCMTMSISMHGYTLKLRGTSVHFGGLRSIWWDHWSNWETRGESQIYLMGIVDLDEGPKTVKEINNISLISIKTWYHMLEVIHYSESCIRQK